MPFEIRQHIYTDNDGLLSVAPISEDVSMLCLTVKTTVPVLDGIDNTNYKISNTLETFLLNFMYDPSVAFTNRAFSGLI